MAAAASSKLFKPFRVGDITLKHRVVMAPLTRKRADDQHVHRQIGLEHYRQRASTPGTLLITEATVIAPEAGTYVNVPGIYTDEQIVSWKTITDAVHAKGSFIFLQLWAMGRTTDPTALAAEGFDVTAPSAIPMPDGPVPRPLTKVEIKHFVNLHAEAARNAIFRAGFDGVEIHGANGYLVDQFLQDVSNNRTDEYGGSIEDRTRFALEVIKAVSDAVGESKTAIRLSPWSTYQGMRMADPVSTFSHLIGAIRERHPNLAYLHLIEPDGKRPEEESNEFARLLWQPRPYLSAGGYDAISGPKAADEKDIAVVYGKAFIANPDLPLRIKYGVELNPLDPTTLYSHGPTASKGYTDYPFSKDIPSQENEQPIANSDVNVNKSSSRSQPRPSGLARIPSAFRGLFHMVSLHRR